jgi:hypothetical protein
LPQDKACPITIFCHMYDMTLSPREAIAKFQDLFNEHYYRLKPFKACPPSTHILFWIQPQHEPS